MAAGTAPLLLVIVVFLRTVATAVPYRDPAELFVVRSTNNETNDTAFLVSPVLFRALSDGGHAIGAVAAYAVESFNYVGGSYPEEVVGHYCSENFFSLLGVPAVRGRVLSPGDFAPDAPPVVVVSYRLWRRALGAPSLDGATIRLSTGDVAVVGVMPPTFRFPDAATDVWAPLRTDEKFFGNTVAFLGVVGRLRQPAAPKDVATEVESLGARTTVGGATTLSTVALRDMWWGDLREPLALAGVGAALLLAVATMNVGAILYGRIASRQGGVLVRLALGADRRHITVMLLSHALLAAICALPLTLAFTLAAQAALRQLSSDALAVRPAAFRVTGLPLVVAALAIGPFVSSLIALTHGWRVTPTATSTLRPSHFASRRRWFRNTLTFAQVAVSVTLLTVSLLVVLAYRRTATVSLGFATNRIHVWQVLLPRPRYDQAAQAQYVSEAAEVLRGLPGVEGAEAISFPPLGDLTGKREFTVQRLGLAGRAEFRTVTPGYMALMGIPVLRGRGLQDSDTESAPTVALVSESFARRFLGDNPTETIEVRFPRGDRAMKIVGVVGDVRHAGPEVRAEPTIYVAYAQQPVPVIAFMVRSALPPDPLLRSGRAALARINDEIPVRSPHMLTSAALQAMSRRRFITLVVSLAATVALLVSIAGLFVAVRGASRSREPEIALRVALGAPPRAVVKLLAGETILLVTAGWAVGVAAGAALIRLIGTWAVGIAGSGPVVPAITLVILLALAATALVDPIRRAVRADPAQVLRLDVHY
jgi:predicted permease